MAPSNNSINKLGDRLRSSVSPEALNELSDYLASFAPALETVVDALRELGYQPTARPEKTIHSIRAKLSRQRIILSRMQDIAGCRIVVDNLHQQDLAVDALLGVLADHEVRVRDRRTGSETGYRAVHMLAKIEGKRIEVQIRTRLQQRWAEFSEKVDDQYFPGAKHGEAPPNVLQHLRAASDKVAQIENEYAHLAAVQAKLELTYEESIAISRREWYVEMEEGAFADLIDNIVGQPLDWRR